MKRAVVLLIIIIFCFMMFSCNSNKNDVLNDVTEKIAETVSNKYTTEKTIIIEVKNIGFDDELYVPFSSEDTKKAETIIKNHEQTIDEAEPDCLFDFNVRIDGVEYAYHYECGSFENISSGNIKEFQLSEEDKDAFNRILFEYVPHSSPCQPIVNFTEPESATTPVTLRCFYDTTENLSFTLTKSTVSAADFSIKMLKETIKQEKNALISPVSLITALSMTANGAKGDTLKQMESVLGGEIEQLNRFYSKSAVDGEGIKTANSIWIRKTPSLNIKQSFIDINKKYYDAEIFREAFDVSTLRKINRWVDDNTDGMIKNGLDDLPSDAVMYIINTVLFDAEWEKKFESHQVMENDDFTTENGEIQKVSMLCDSTEGNEYNYITVGKTEGMVMDYTNGYSFAALLPDEGTSISEALNSFSGNELAYTLVRRAFADKNQEGDFLLYTKIPKFSFECRFSFGKTLAKLGMPHAFDPLNADLTGISNSPDNPLFISEVYHNTSISLTENGTKAGAATYVEIKCGSAMLSREIKNLYFDRPFIYIIYETKTGIPLFIGTVTDFNS